jgi:hypothetical protein
MSKFRIISEYNYFKPFHIQEDDDLDIEAGADSPPVDDLDSGFDDMGGDTQDVAEDPLGEPPVADPLAAPVGGDKVEVDVTGIVEKQQQITDALNAINSMLEKTVTGMNQNFEAVVGEMKKQNKATEEGLSQLGNKMQDEFLKRIPTPNESILVQTASSYPYNIKLSDYWKPASNEEMKYSTSNPEKPQGDLYSKIEKQGQETEEKDYTLSIKDINADFNPSAVGRSF